MSDLVGNSEDWLYLDMAHTMMSLPCQLSEKQEVQRRIVLVVNFFVFLKLDFIARLLLHLTLCIMHNVEATFQLP